MRAVHDIDIPWDVPPRGESPIPSNPSWTIPGVTRMAPAADAGADWQLIGPDRAASPVPESETAPITLEVSAREVSTGNVSAATGFARLRGGFASFGLHAGALVALAVLWSGPDTALKAGHDDTAIEVAVIVEAAPPSAEAAPEPIVQADLPDPVEPTILAQDLPTQPEPQVTVDLPPPVLATFRPSDTIVARPAEPKKPQTKPVETARPVPPRPRPAVARATPAPAASAPSAAPAAAPSRATLSNYNGTVAAHLARYKQYPSEARAQRLSGRPMVRFVLSASGAVLQVQVVNGSGSPILDRAAEAMVRRAAPFPPIPQDVGRTTLAFSVPVSFAATGF